MSIADDRARPRSDAAGRAQRLEPSDLVDLLGLPFSDEQLAAITAPESSGLIEAAAGSGKTTVMAARVVWLVGTGAVRPSQVLGLTFTRKAAAELAQRVREALDVADLVDSRAWLDEEPLVATYDAFAASLVADYGAWLGRDEAARLLDDAARFKLAAETVARSLGPLPCLSRLAPSSITRALLGLDSAMGANLVADAAVRRHSQDLLRRLDSAPLNRNGRPQADVVRARRATEERLELLKLRLDYQARKRAGGLTEFADQLADAVALARTVPAVRADLRERFKVVLLDEYQDTSAAQAILLRDLFGPASGQVGLPVTAVGDPRQAIYGWRGASASNLGEFCRDFVGSKGEAVATYGLTVNRRSDRAILDAANRLAGRWRPAAAPDPDDGPLAAPGVAGPDPRHHLRAAASAGAGAVVTSGFLTWDEEVAWIADRIAGGISRGEIAEWSQIAVLSRRNVDLGPLWQALADRDVPVEIVGLGGLLHVPEIADLVAVLKLIEEPRSGPDLVRVLTRPRWRLRRPELAALGRRAGELARAEGAGEPTGDDIGTQLGRIVDNRPSPGLAAALADPGPGVEEAVARRLRRCHRELVELGRHRLEPVSDLVERVIAVTGLELELASRPEPMGSARRRQVTAFRAAVADYAAGDRTAGLAGFLGWLDAEAEFGLGLGRATASADNSVKLLTIHKAKGLEWDVVYLPGLVAKVFPSDRVTANPYRAAAALPHELRGDRAALPQLGDVSGTGLRLFGEAMREDLIQAEDRLAYVAATRARHVLVGTTHRWRAGAARSREPSPYFAVLDEVAQACGQRSGGPPEAGSVNPLGDVGAGADWPVIHDLADDEANRAVRARVEQLRRSGPPARAEISAGLASAPAEVGEVLRRWDEAGARLLAAAWDAGPRSPIDVTLPANLTASQLVWLQRAPAEFAAALVRPTPRPSSPGARVGRSFHEWFEQEIGRPSLIDDLIWADDGELLPGPTAGAKEQAAVEVLRSRFRAGRFGGAVPEAVEHSFTMTIAGMGLRGRIDAVYGRGTAPAVVPEGYAYLVVDWKTGLRPPDPLQLSVYRVAWARAAGVAVDKVAAGFYRVAEDRFDRVTDLLDEAALGRLMAGLGER